MPYKDEWGELKTDFTINFKKVHGDWAAKRVPQVVECESIIIIGGNEKTAHVAHIAPSLHKPLLAIPCFGGIAKEIWQQLEPYYRNIGALNDHIERIVEHWNTESADYSVSLITKLKKLGLFSKNKKMPNLSLSFVSIIALSLWVYYFTNPINNNMLVIFLLLALSAILGTSLRTLLSSLLDDNPPLNWNIIIIEMSAGLILALGLSLIYLVEGFTVTGKFEFVSLMSNRSDFIRISIFMSLLGLAGGFLIEKTSDFLRTRLSQVLDNIDGPSNQP